MRSDRAGLVCAASLLLAMGANAAAQDVVTQALGDTGSDLAYTPVAPCRIIDTRLAGGPLVPGTPRDFHVVGTADFDLQGGLAGGCGIPSGATAALLNFVAVAPAGAGNLRSWAFGQTPQLAAILNYAAVPGLAIANGVVVPLCDPAGGPCALDLTVSANVSSTQLVVDVMGYMRGVAAESVTTGLLANGAVTLGKLDTNSVDASKIVDGSVGSAEVDNSQVQLRVGGICAAGSSISAIAADGTVTCEADDVASTVTLVKTIPALTCTAQSTALSGDSDFCSGGNTVRTDGDSQFPCVVRGRPTRDTWLCELDLPSNAQITNITANGFDSATGGYMEASVWRTAANSFGPEYFSNFGGTWQSSGLAAAPGSFTFPIFSAPTPHTVSGDQRYVIGFGLKAPLGQTVYAFGFRVTYTITQ